MPVNVNSVISTSINSFDPDLYVSLTDKEDYLYTTSILGETFYKPFVINLNAAILAWMSSPFTGVQDLIQGIYSGEALTNLYGGTPSTPDSRSIFTMNGWRTSIKTAPINVWDDGVYAPPAPDSAPTLEADTAQITGSPSIDQSTLTSASNTAQSGVSSFMFSNLFEDVPQLNPPLTKQDLGTFIFTTLHYKEVALYLNVGSIPLPSYI